MGGDMPRRHAAMLNMNASWALNNSFVVTGLEDYCDRKTCLAGSDKPDETSD